MTCPRKSGPHVMCKSGWSSFQCEDQDGTQKRVISCNMVMTGETCIILIIIIRIGVRSV